MNEQQWKLLVLEDDPNLREVLCEVLREEGYRVVAACDGATAVQLASQETFDLIVTDIRMDGLDGLEALEKARSYLPDLASLVVSGYATEAETLRALSLNVGGYLKKPFSLSDFLEKTRQLLGQRRLEQEHQDARRHLLRSLWWAVQRHPQGNTEAANLAVYLSQCLSLPEQVTQTIRLACLLQGAQGSSQWPPEASLDRVGLGPIVRLLEEVRGGNPLSLEAQVVQTSQRLLEYFQQSEEAGRGLEEILADWNLPPALAGAVDSFRKSGTIAVEQAVAQHENRLGLTAQYLHHRTLLGLAGALEQAGDWSLARQAYQRVSILEDLAQNDRQRSLVGLARCCFYAKEQDWYEPLKEAELLSRGLGPVAKAMQRWPIADLLLRSYHPSTNEYLKTLEAEFAQLGLWGKWAKTRMARRKLDPQSIDEDDGKALALLLLPEHLTELSGESDWLVPQMLRLGASGPQTPGLDSSNWASLIGQQASVIVRWVQELGAYEPTLDFLLACLEGGPQRASESILGALEGRWKELSPRIRQIRQLQGNKAARDFVRFKTFGVFEVQINGERVADSLWKTQKTKFLLAYVLSHQGAALSDDVILDHFWPESKGDSKSNLWSAIKGIRKALRHLSLDKEFEFLVREGERTLLAGDLQYWYDRGEFEQLLVDIPTGQDVAWSPEQVDRVKRAVSLVSGAYLDGCYLDWAVRARDQLECRLFQLWLNLATNSLSQRPLESVEYASRALELDPLSQEAHLVKMQGLLAAQQPENVIRQFQQCEKSLFRELGIEPRTALMELYYKAKLTL